MNVFISFSGENGKQIAKILHEYLPRFIQAVRPFYSEESIEKGAVWSNKLFESLSECQHGLIVLTKDCIESRWIYFESGAIFSKFGTRKVVPILFGLEKFEIGLPLNSFQMAEFNREEFAKILSMLNEDLKSEKLDDEILESTISAFWDRMIEKINSSIETKTKQKVDEINPIDKIIKSIEQINLDMQEQQRGMYYLRKSMQSLERAILRGQRNMDWRDANVKKYISSQLNDNFDDNRTLVKHYISLLDKDDETKESILKFIENSQSLSKKKDMDEPDDSEDSESG